MQDDRDQSSHHEHMLNAVDNDGGAAVHDKSTTSSSSSTAQNQPSSLDDIVISPSMGEEYKLYDVDGSTTPINPFRLDNNGHSESYHDKANTEDKMNGSHSLDSEEDLADISISSPQSTQQNAGGNTMEDLENDPPDLTRNPSLSLSAYSGYDSEEDEDGILGRYGIQVLASTSNAVLGMRSHDDDESVYSAVNTSAEMDDENDHRLRSNTSDTSFSRSSSSNGGSRNPRRKKKRPRDRIKDAINGMRRAHQDAQRQRSTRRFLAMSEGTQTPHSFTETICLSPWCDFSSGRGMVIMFASALLCILVAVALGGSGHITGGICTVTISIVIILVRRFWVAIYWLVWGQFLEKRRRRNMQVYDTLNGENPGGLEIPVQEFESVQDFDDVDGEVEFTGGLEFDNEDEEEAECTTSADIV